MTLAEVKQIVVGMKLKNRKHWHVWGPGEFWENERFDPVETQDDWGPRRGAIAVIMPPGAAWMLERKSYEDGKTYYLYDEQGWNDELYVYEDSTPEDVRNGVDCLNREYVERLQSGWQSCHLDKDLPVYTREP